MTPESAADAFESMAEQRKQELAADADAYRLRKACEAHAVELYHALRKRYYGQYSIAEVELLCRIGSV